MADLVNIGFRLDTSQIDKGYKRLNKMGESAEKAEGKLNKMAKGANAAGSAVATIGTATTAAAAALVAFMNHIANVERELQASARMAGLTTDQFEAMGFAYRQFGLTVEQVNDIYKDSRERVGEWLSSQSGALQDFGDVIGMSKDEITAFAKEVDGLTGQQLLQRMVNDMEAAGASTNEMSFALEGMASEATRMIPALENNGKAVNDLSNEYVKFNSAFSLNDEDVQNYADLAKSFDLFLDVAQNGITQVLAPVAEWLSVMTMEVTEFVAALNSGSVIAAENKYSEALAEQLEARRLLGEAQNIPAAFGQDVIDQETKIAQARLDAANKAVEAADKQLEAAKKTAQAQLEVNRTSTRNININLGSTSTSGGAKEKTFGELFGGTNTVDLFELNKFREQLSKEQINPFEAMATGAQDALSAMSGMFESGSKEAMKLSVAIQSINTALAVQKAFSAATSANIMGAITSGLGLLASFDSMFGGELVADFDEIQKKQGLNQWGEKAESIADATDMTANATEKLVGINTDMLEALKGLNLSILSASGIIARDTTIPSADPGITGNIYKDLIGINAELAQAVDTVSLAAAGFVLGGPIGGLIGGALGFALGGLLGGSSKVSDEGIRIIGGALSDLLDDVTVQAFQTVKYKKWRFGSSKKKTQFENLGDEVSNQIGLVFESIVDSVVTGAEILGLSNQEISAALDAIEIETKKISLKGMTAGEQQEAINNYFSQVFNQVAADVVPFLSEFQQVGEELGVTLSRLATEVNVAEYLVNNFGVTFGDKMSDPKAFTQAADNLASLAGGVEELADQVSGFTNAFATDAQKFQIYQDALNSALGDVGLSLPGTAEGMFELMSSLDGTTESGQEQIATLLGLTDTADAYFKLLDKTAGAYRDAAEGLFDITEASRAMSLESALAAARLGDFSLAEQLDLGSIGPSTRDFNSALEFNLARAETAAKLNELADLQSGQVTVEDKQLTVLEQIRDKLADGDTIGANDVKTELMALRNQMNKQQTETNDYLRRMAYQGA